jgi:hypothetical protein
MSIQRGDSIAAMLQRTERELRSVREKYLALGDTNEVPLELRVDIHDLLNHHRALLEYSAQEIAAICYPRPKRPGFPIANRSKKREDFAKEIDQKFPGLSRGAPELRDYLLSVQHFRGDPWLDTFNTLANQNKHDELSHQIRGEFIAAYIGADDLPPAITILGTGALNLAEGAVLRVNSRRGRPLRVRGPSTINVETEALDAEVGIYWIRTRWTDFRFSDVTDHSVIGLLEIVDRGVRTIVDRVLYLVGAYHAKRASGSGGAG